MNARVLRIAAFCDGARGGNPAGVMIADRHPDENDMRRIAAEVGYSETAFAMPRGDAGRELMRREGIITILLAWAETPRLFHTRNPFAAGGVYEDPATGAATAAFAGYLRDLGWPHGGSIEILQGEDMGSPSRLQAEITPTPGEPIRVSGRARFIEE